MSDEQAQTTCGSLLRELQHIWDEVGESDDDRDKMLLQLEQECLDVYRRKVDQAGHGRDLLHQAITDAEAEVASLYKALGERYMICKGDRKAHIALKQQLQAIHPLLEELRKKRDDRLRGIEALKDQIQSILLEIAGKPLGDGAIFAATEEQDLSLARLEEYHTHLHALRQGKEERMQRVCANVTAITEFCAILGLDSEKMVIDVHPTLGNFSSGHTKSISDDTLHGLKLAMESLRLQKKQRLSKLQSLCSPLIELWTLMDTPAEDQRDFQSLTVVVNLKDEEVFTPGILSLDSVKKVENEVNRLHKLMENRMKELILKKIDELNRISEESHMDPHPDACEENLLADIDSGLFNASELLGRMDKYIADANEQALSRKDILEKMEKWLSACEEESWLEDYNHDENRYNASRGAHINLKRAERARITIQKLPSMVENLIAKTKAWEENKGTLFLYDGVRLLDILDEHNVHRKEREQEKRRLRDQKKLQEQLVTEQETLFGSRPSPHKPAASAKKGLTVRANGSNNIADRRLTMAGPLLQTAAGKNGVTPGKSGTGKHQQDKSRPAAPVNYVALSKEESVVVA